MKTNLKLFWYYIEILFSRLITWFGFKHNDKVIPKGYYCYEIDHERNLKEGTEFGYYIKPCKYYRSTTKTGGIACIYLGYFGFDPGLYDQCKLCGKNMDD